MFDWLIKINQVLNRLLMIVGGLFLIGMCALTCTNILLRTTWIPVRGTFELMGYFGAVVTTFALGTTQMRRGHISVNVLVNSFSKTVRTLLTALNHLVCAIFFSLAVWQLSQKAATLMRTGEVTETLRIVYYPFTIAVAVGCLALVLELVVSLLQMSRSGKEGAS
jgi:TRAP-type C4-dicarboxylate transport system permease small subunit